MASCPAPSFVIPGKNLISKRGQLKSTYIRELPDLAYQNIPSEQEIKQSFIELSSQLF